VPVLRGTTRLGLRESSAGVELEQPFWCGLMERPR